MVSITRHAALSGVLLVGLTLGCGRHKPPVNDMPDPSPTRPLSGTVVTSDDMARTPDGWLSVRIRGATTINGATEPLYVIDGLPIQPGSGGSLVGINPSDIASIEVLKDAADLAFYGVRGANGVIIVKTKHSNTSQ
jgi:TonB-dependent SusC/RagA subfamily outer membrane receptor